MNKKNKTAIVLLLVISMALIVSALDRGGMLRLFDRTKRNREPSDVRDNLFYDRKKPCTSSNILDRSGFAFLNLQERIVAIQLSSGINIDVVKSGSEQAPYVKFSEYAGFVYMYDGASLWRTSVEGGRVSQITDGVLDYQPMGDYIYFLKVYMDEPRLFRSRLNGSGQEILFDFPVYEFRAFAGRLLMLREERNGSLEHHYTCYNVLSKREEEDVTLPANADVPELDEDALYYVLKVGGERVLHRRSLVPGEPCTTVVGRGFADWEAGPDGIAMLIQDGESGLLRYYDKITGTERIFGQQRFSAEAAVDLSWDRIYVTDAGGVFYSPVAQEDWRLLPVKGYSESTVDTEAEVTSTGEKVSGKDVKRLKPKEQG